MKNLDFVTGKIKKPYLENSARELAKKIFGDFMLYRRVPRVGDECANENCEQCTSMHLEKIISAVVSNEAVTFVLPAFPGKSPNPEKVLGPLPDFAEELSLKFLNGLCEKIKTYYEPGVKIIICSDGRVFSDVVGMREHHVTEYQMRLDEMITELSLSDISTFNLDHVFSDLNFSQMRDELMKKHGKSLEFLQHKIRSGNDNQGTVDEQEANRMFRGMTRFMLEDSTFKGQTKSRAALQKLAKAKAYEVIRRSNAWSELIAEHFPYAVRLSIHPQACGGKKLGLRLVGNESWMTPWHGVALETRNGFVLMKRAEAEALNAELIFFSDGRPSHFKLQDEKEILLGGF